MTRRTWMSAQIKILTQRQEYCARLLYLIPQELGIPTIGQIDQMLVELNLGPRGMKELEYYLARGHVPEIIQERYAPTWRPPGATVEGSLEETKDQTLLLGPVTQKITITHDEAVEMTAEDFFRIRDIILRHLTPSLHNREKHDRSE